LIVAVEGLVVLGVIRMGAHEVLGGDGPEYQRYARNLVSHGAFSNAPNEPFSPSVFRTPGYPLFLALFRLVAPGSLLLVRIAQFALLGLTALLVYRVALTLTTRRAALASAIGCATFLPLVWLATYHLTEILATFLAVGVVLLFLKARAGPTRSGTLGRYAAVGLATGALSLVRPEDALLIAPIAVALFISDRAAARISRVRNVAILLAGFALVIAPWTIRNAIVAHSFIPLSANSGQSLYISSQQYAGRISYANTPADYELLYRPGGLFAQITGHSSPFASPIGGERVELKANDAIQSAAGREFRKLSAGTILRSVPTRLAHLWGTADYPPVGRSFSTAVHRLAVVQYALILVLALAGILLSAMAGRVRDMWPLLLFPAYTTFVHLVFNVEARFTIPDRPFLIVFAGIALVRLAELLAGRFTFTRPLRTTARR
jgi:4-amino-4-deoxy-L-arabinose transferase-like glycosyltransferase